MAKKKKTQVPNKQTTKDTNVPMPRPPGVGPKSAICVCMIVKNESKVIERCLNSVLKSMNLKYVSICDTGSTDNP